MNNRFKERRVGPRQSRQNNYIIQEIKIVESRDGAVISVILLESKKVIILLVIYHLKGI